MDETPQVLRAFAAVELAEPVRAKIAALVKRLRNMPMRVSWVPPGNLHLTLRFLGAIESDRIEAYAVLLRPKLAPIAPFAVGVRGVGAFPGARRPEVIWTALECESDALECIATCAEHCARAIGLAPETRAFIPHVTLARIRRGARVDLAPVLEAGCDFNAGEFTIDAVSLLLSELTPHGARYTRLHRLTLDGIRGTRHL